MQSCILPMYDGRTSEKIIFTKPYSTIKAEKEGLERPVSRWRTVHSHRSTVHKRNFNYNHSSFTIRKTLDDISDVSHYIGLRLSTVDCGLRSLLLTIPFENYR